GSRLLPRSSFTSRLRGSSRPSTRPATGLHPPPGSRAPPFQHVVGAVLDAPRGGSPDGSPERKLLQAPELRLDIFKAGEPVSVRRRSAREQIDLHEWDRRVGASGRVHSGGTLR